MTLTASSANKDIPRDWSIPLSIHGPSLPVAGTKINYGDWTLVLVLSGSLASPARLASLQAPFVACLKSEEVLLEGSGELAGSSYVAVFRPQIVNQEIPDFLSLPPKEIPNPFMRRDVEIVQPFVANTGLCRELTAKDADFLSMMMKNAWTLCGEQSDPYWPCRTKSYLLEVLVFLAIDKSGGDDVDSSRAEQVRDFIHLNYSKKLTLDEIAREFGTNRTSLQRQFKAAYGESVFEYLSSYRFRMVQTLMRNTELSLKEVALRTGYSDYSHFFRDFSAREGMSPADWRHGDSRVRVY